MKWISTLVVILLSCTLLSCKQDEMDDLAKAQKCLDEVPQSNPEAASACYAYVEKYNSQQANILKCSILMTSGGLTEDKMVSAYKVIDDDTNSNKEAAFMSVLALNKPNVNDGYDKAVRADVFCQASGIPGLKYISGIIKIGSFMAKSLAAFSGIDFNDPNAVAGAIGSLVDECTSDPRGANCPTDLTAIGTSAVELSESYCSTESADEKVCADINAAVDSAGGVPSAVGAALFCYMDGKVYDSATGLCKDP